METILASSKSVALSLFTNQIAALVARMDEMSASGNLENVDTAFSHILVIEGKENCMTISLLPHIKLAEKNWMSSVN